MPVIMDEIWMIAPLPQFEPRSEKVKVTKSRSKLFKDAQEVIANNRRKREGAILEYEGKLDRLMAVFDAARNDPKSQNQKRQVIELVDTAREMRQAWVNRLDECWENYESAYSPLNDEELAMFEAAIARAEAPLDVQDRGISLLGGPHVTQQPRAIEGSSRSRAPASFCLLEPSSATAGKSTTHRSIATGYSQPQSQCSTAVSSNYSSRRSGATSRATSARSVHSTARPPTTTMGGARVAETGSLSRRGSTTARGTEAPSSSREGTKGAPKQSGRMDLLRKATTAKSSVRPSAAESTGKSGVVHVSGLKSTRR